MSPRAALLRAALFWAAVLSVGALAVTGCATTIESSASDSTEVATTTTAPSGSAAELLPRLVAAAGELSNIIGDRGDKQAQLDTIEALYAAVRPELAAADGVGVLDFDGAMELCRRAERFNRPADADKCYRNLSALADGFLGG